MLAEQTIAALAAELHDAEKRRIQLRNISKRHPEMTNHPTATRSSAPWLQLKLAEGRVVKGRKIGLTSRAMQLSSQITEPDYAPLLDDMFFEAGGDIRSIASSRRGSRSSSPSSSAGR
jgi:2-oxo-hept-3-ene-1,7-dioate hydratase